MVWYGVIIIVGVYNNTIHIQHYLYEEATSKSSMLCYYGNPIESAVYEEATSKSCSLCYYGNLIESAVYEEATSKSSSLCYYGNPIESAVYIYISDVQLKKHC